MNYNEELKKQLNLLYQSKEFSAGIEIVSKSWQDYIKYIISNIKIDGYWLEFGCYAGASISFIEKNMPKNIDYIYGFDSFEGLSEVWHKMSLKAFNRNGEIPKLNNKRIKFIKGYFNETIPIFVKEMKKNVAFIHIDSDLYSSCTTILSYLKEKIIPGTIIAFDEIHNWQECLDGEMKALIESEIKYEWIAHTQYVQAAIRIIE